MMIINDINLVSLRDDYSSSFRGLIAYYHRTAAKRLIGKASHSFRELLITHRIKSLGRGASAGSKRIIAGNRALRSVLATDAIETRAILRVGSTNGVLEKQKNISTIALQFVRKLNTNISWIFLLHNV